MNGGHTTTRRDCINCLSTVGICDDLCPKAELHALLAQTYTPRGVEVWRAHAIRQGWSLGDQLVKARAMAEGTFV